MKSEAKIMLFGHVGEAPKMPSEKYPNFVTFSLAVTETWKDKNDQQQTNTDWYNISTSQEGLSGIIKKYVQKGNPLYVEGSPKYKTYKSNDGTSKVQIDVNLSKIKLLGSKPENGEEPAQPTLRAVPAANSSSIIFDDEIPF